jgi:hypothetical protein
MDLFDPVRSASSRRQVEPLGWNTHGVGLFGDSCEIVLIDEVLVPAAL